MTLRLTPLYAAELYTTVRFSIHNHDPGTYSRILYMHPWIPSICGGKGPLPAWTLECRSVGRAAGDIRHSTTLCTTLWLCWMSQQINQHSSRRWSKGWKETLCPSILHPYLYPPIGNGPRAWWGSPGNPDVSRLEARYLHCWEPSGSPMTFGDFRRFSSPTMALYVKKILILWEHQIAGVFPKKNSIWFLLLTHPYMIL